MVEILKPFKHTFQDYPDPKESSVTVFFTRCEHRCPGCHNWQLVDVDESHIINRSRYQMTHDAMIMFHRELVVFGNRCRTNKIVLQGGDPLHPHNRHFVSALLRHNAEECSNILEFCIFTGYTIHEVKEFGLTGFTFLKCGRYDEKQYQTPNKNSVEFTLTSKNQELYDWMYAPLSNNGVYKFPKEKTNEPNGSN